MDTVNWVVRQNEVIGDIITLTPLWHILADLWNRIQPLLAPEKPPGTVGLYNIPHRVVLEAIL